MTADKPIVFIVDDDDGVRNTLRLMSRSIGLEGIPFATPQDFLDAYDPRQPGCLVLDLQMPQMSGLELQRLLNLRGAVIPVIFITGHADVPTAVEAMQDGAFAFLEKPFSPTALAEKIQRALVRDAASREAVAERTRNLERYGALTPRERQILNLVASGKPNKIMAIDLGVSQRTVEVHRARVMEKMGAQSLAELVRMVLDIDITAIAE